MTGPCGCPPYVAGCNPACVSQTFAHPGGSTWGSLWTFFGVNATNLGIEWFGTDPVTEISDDYYDAHLVDWPSESADYPADIDRQGSQSINDSPCDITDVTFEWYSTSTFPSNEAYHADVANPGLYRMGYGIATQSLHFRLGSYAEVAVTMDGTGAAWALRNPSSVNSYRTPFPFTYYVANYYKVRLQIRNGLVSAKLWRSSVNPEPLSWGTRAVFNAPVAHQIEMLAKRSLDPFSAADPAFAGNVGIYLVSAIDCPVTPPTANQPIQDEVIGVGDGTTTVFYTNWPYDPATLEVEVDGYGEDFIPTNWHNGQVTMQIAPGAALEVRATYQRAPF